MYEFQYTVIQSFGVCLQINCLVTQRPKHFQFWTRLFFFERRLIGSGLGLMIFHKMSPRTHNNYLKQNHCDSYLM